MPERAALFLDGAYLEFFLNKTYNQAPLDFAKLVRVLTPPQSRLIRAYYYHSLPFVDDDSEEKIWQLYEGRKRFFHALSMRAGLTVRQGRVTRRFDANGEPVYSQQGTDILLALDLASFALKHLIDYAVVLTGDSSFVPVIQLAQNEGVRTVVWHAPTESGSNRLLIAADESYPVDQALVDLCAPEPEERELRREVEASPEPVRTASAPAPMPLPARSRSLPASSLRAGIAEDGAVRSRSAPAADPPEADPWDD